MKLNLSVAGSVHRISSLLHPPPRPGWVVEDGLTADAVTACGKRKFGRLTSGEPTCTECVREAR